MSRAPRGLPRPPQSSLDWQSRAACQGKDPTLFDPMDGGRPSNKDWHRIARARQVCKSCPVQDPCLRSGIENGDSGVRGDQYLAYGKAFPVREPVYTHQRRRKAAA